MNIIQIQFKDLTKDFIIDNINKTKSIQVMYKDQLLATINKSKFLKYTYNLYNKKYSPSFKNYNCYEDNEEVIINQINSRFMYTYIAMNKLTSYE